LWGFCGDDRSAGNTEHITAGVPATATIYGGEVIGFTEACDECVAVHQRLAGGTGSVG
jgi:hypothetical protein